MAIPTPTQTHTHDVISVYRRQTKRHARKSASIDLSLFFFFFFFHFLQIHRPLICTRHSWIINIIYMRVMPQNDRSNRPRSKTARARVSLSLWQSPFDSGHLDLGHNILNGQCEQVANRLKTNSTICVLSNAMLLFSSTFIHKPQPTGVSISF